MSEKSKIKLLFITRKYPHSVGGMEKVSYCLGEELKKKVDTKIIAWGKSQKWLPYFLPKAFFEALIIIYRDGITNIHLGDGLLAPLGLLLKAITGKKVTVTIHGLDITYKNSLYQLVVPWCVSKLDKVICVSEATLKECVKRGIPKEMSTVIHWGIYPEEYKISATRADLENIAGRDLDGKKVIITVGRLVKRKGVYWFIDNVLPKLDHNFVYLIIGDGPERARIEDLIKTLNLKDRALLLGRVSDHDLKIIYNTADIFVMPNIEVEGDIEGFGIVAMEAASTGMLIVASYVDGMKDLLNEKVGIPVKERVDFAPRIKKALKDREQNSNISKNVASYIQDNFSWTSIREEYIKAAVR